jgi:hypothetical protein
LEEIRFRPWSSSEYCDGSTVDVGRRYRPRASFALVRFAAGRGAFRSRGSVGRIGLPDRTSPGRGGDATSHPLGASRTRFTAAGARFSAGRQPSSPAGRVTAPVGRLVRTTLVRFRVCGASLQRSPVAPCRPGVAESPDHPAAAFFRAAGTHPVCACARAVFRRLAFPRHFIRSGNAAVAGHSPPDSFTAVYRARGLFSRPGRAGISGPPTLVGFACTLRSVAPGGAVGGVFRASPGPPAVWTGPPPRVFWLAGARQVVARGRGSVVRLLGVRPAAKPFPAVHRPRYSFCAEGRRDARAVAALGFGFLCQAFGIAGRGSPLLEPFRRGLSSAARSSLQRPGTSRWSSCPRRCAGPRA